MKKTDGFTLVELVVGILATTLVSGAIMTFLLMGLKANRATIDANTDQRNAKIMITMMEKLASEGSIASIESVGNGNNPDWVVLAPPVEEGNPNSAPILLSYTASSNSLRGKDGVILMEGVLSSTIDIVKETLPGTGCLLHFTLKTAAGEYESSVFCRSEVIDEAETLIDANVKESEIEVTTEFGTTSPSADAARLTLLTALVNQLDSDGRIIENGVSTIPFSLWYCDEKYNTNNKYLPNWNANTPWCACFASWAIAQVSGDLKTVPCEADVDALWAQVSKNQTISRDHAAIGVRPGDLIFFNWDTDEALEHVGIVLLIEGDYVYTIEGNSSNRVALRRYALDTQDIHGYAVLDWAT